MTISAGFPIVRAAAGPTSSPVMIPKLIVYVYQSSEELYGHWIRKALDSILLERKSMVESIEVCMLVGCVVC